MLLSRSTSRQWLATFSHHAMDDVFHVCLGML